MSGEQLPNERSRLLQPNDEGSHDSSSASAVDPESAHDDDYDGHSIRRLSSTNLPPYHENYPATEEPSSAVAIWTVVPVSLLGVFVANADGSLVVASSQYISSEFHQLDKASWLIMSFTLGVCASQPLYGKLSDIFGRKANLIVAYVFFTAGCFLCGAAQQYWHILAGRAISGIGGAGMTALVSVIIADMVPVRDVAAWRSYVNVAATTGRSLGGPVGGWLTETVGWRWAFYGQCPLTLAGLLLIMLKLPHKSNQTGKILSQSFSHKIRRVDAFGAITLAGAICSFLLLLQTTTDRMAWQYSLAAGLSFGVLSASFVAIEYSLVAEPILPLGLLAKRAVITSYLVAGAQIAAQFSMFYLVPVYFQLAGYSVSAAGLRLVPAVIGNAVGGLISGVIIQATGRYKPFTIFASTAASLGYLLILLRWHGTTHWIELTYFFLGGFGSGVIQSTSFVHLAASLDQSEIAIAGTVLYLIQNIFLLVGIQSATAVLQQHLQSSLARDLDGVNDKAEVIKKVTSNIQLIWTFPDYIKNIVLRDYFNSLTAGYGKPIHLCRFFKV
ncbi:hypothetical protein PV08_02234 [Exophiala spinifera]|uniref:Major facilitator superfamily (MFS) profile domain-containing protein n=1 Tax=Exophiala spinifera TaxID=91928 RepID=A0A0D2CDN4_9EURO|nr:uncharacterized protein PV08_02234 [Exophiala spinifera]KIW21654.1 hypothetical protein PV08_02234 [Exophiala spinifera]